MDDVYLLDFIRGFFADDVCYCLLVSRFLKRVLVRFPPGVLREESCGFSWALSMLGEMD